ncbi:MAG: hypothetical protein KJ944_17535 [Alphaproteobacteria bacterium]|nr:hypothetical protein [Alphaproteobacteria bacterium]MBU1559607.1 hypothetical protein [Alphaproteobacteria bacterium]MBU2304394.1 hypothetical protein [Alphaproteobacteria bacterium]MBU2367179.1 hypothetical protein [Alphaproteobacteria bacterium]
MQFLVLTTRKTETFGPEEFAHKLPAEIARARELYGEGFTRQIWHRADGRGACQIVEAPDERSAAEKINTLPFVELGMLEVSIIALKPYQGFLNDFSTPSN